MIYNNDLSFLLEKLREAVRSCDGKEAELYFLKIEKLNKKTPLKEKAEEFASLVEQAKGIFGAENFESESLINFERNKKRLKTREENKKIENKLRIFQPIVEKLSPFRYTNITGREIYFKFTEHLGNKISLEELEIEDLTLPFAVSECEVIPTTQEYYLNVGVYKQKKNYQVRIGVHTSILEGYISKSEEYIASEDTIIELSSFEVCFLKLLREFKTQCENEFKNRNGIFSKNIQAIIENRNEINKALSGTIQCLI